MYRHKLTAVKPRTETQAMLQANLLAYHDFRVARFHHPLLHVVAEIERWQSARLQHTHHGLYQDPRYRQALDFLLKDLYTPTHFTRRDEDLDRIFPVMVKMVPEQALGTVSRLVELNLLTQELDLALAHKLTGGAGWCDRHLHPDFSARTITEAEYLNAYRACQNESERLRQIELADSVGHQLERYVHSRFLSASLKVTRKAAEVAGLGQLHDFLRRGMSAFRSMGGVAELLSEVTRQEKSLLHAAMREEETPYGFNPQDAFS